MAPTPTQQPNLSINSSAVPFSGTVGSASTYLSRTVSSPTPGGTPTTTGAHSDLLPLRLELEHKAAEIQLKTKTIAKLEQEVLYQVKEAEMAKARETEAVEAVAAKAKKEAEANAGKLENLRQELGRALETAEAYRMRINDLEAEVKGLSKVEVRLKETERILDDRTQRLEELRKEKRQAEDSLRDYQRNDQSKVMEGRLEAVSSLAEQAEKRAKDLELQLEQRAREIETLQEEAKVAVKKHGILEREIASREVVISSLKKELEAWPQKQLVTESSVVEARRRLADLEAESEKKESMFQQIIDAMREELRAEHKSKTSVELLLAKEEANNSVLRGQISSLTDALRQETEFRASIEDRLKTYQLSNDEKDALLAKEQVLCRSLKTEVEQQRSMVDAIKGELEKTRDSLHSTVQERDAAQREVSRLEGLEEKLLVLKGIARRQGEDIGHSEAALQQTKDRLQEAESIINKLESLQQEVRNLRRESNVKSSAIDIALREKKLLETSLEETTQQRQSAEAEIKILEAKLSTEKDRRRDLERRLMTLEQGFVGNYAVHGRYEALKTFLESSTSESAKAQQLSFNLLEEVKILEGRLQEAESSADKAREERRRLEVRNAELSSQLPPLLEARERLALVTEELRRANERAFELKKEGIEAQVLGERVKSLVQSKSDDSAELAHLRSQLAELRSSYHAAEIQIERLKAQKEEADANLKVESTARTAERHMLTEGLTDPEGRGTIGALKQLLENETNRRKQLAAQVDELNKQNEVLQNIVDTLRSGSPRRGQINGPTGQNGNLSPIGSGSPGRSFLGTSALSLAQVEELERLKLENLSLHEELAAERAARERDELRVNSLASQLREAMFELASYTNRDPVAPKKQPLPSTQVAGKGGASPRRALSPGAGGRNNTPTRAATPKRSTALVSGVNLSPADESMRSPVRRGNNSAGVSKGGLATPAGVNETPNRQGTLSAVPAVSPNSGKPFSNKVAPRASGKSGVASHADPIALPPPPTSTQRSMASSPKRATVPNPQPNGETDTLRKQNIELSVQLSDAKNRLAAILQSPRGYTNPAAHAVAPPVAHTLYPDDRFSDVISPKRPN
jgi:chromosome segregation ATPase